VLQSFMDGVTGMVCSVASVFVVPTILMLLVKQFVPVLGEHLWRGYCQLLVFMFTAPIKLIKLLINEIRKR
jgi:hypothetical protein